MKLLGLTAFFCFSLAVCPASDAWSLPPEDLEASGDDLEMDGSGSGDGLEGVILDEKWTKLDKGREDTNWKEDQGYEEPDSEEEPWNVILQESKSSMPSKEVLAGVIAGGVGGLMLGIVLAGFLIYKWHKKDSTGYSQGMRRIEQDYLKVQRGALPGEDSVLV